MPERRNHSSWRGWGGFGAVVLAGLLLLLPAVRAEDLPGEGGGPVINNFTLREFDDDGQLAWQVFGQRALITGSRVRLTGAQILCRNGGELYRIFTPACEFDRTTKTGRGDQRLQMRSRNLLIEGIGFDLDLGTRRLSIRSQVKLRILGEQANLLGKPLE